MQYNFNNLNETNTVNSNITAESVIFEFGLLEELIEGYTTISVEGRDILGKNIVSQEMELKDGTVFRSANYPDRTIKVNYLLIGGTPQQLIDKLNKINHYFRKNKIKFKFNDELNYQYEGTVSNESGNIDSGQTNIFGSFTIICNDPFKYSPQIEKTGDSNLNLNVLSYNYNVQIDILELTLKESTTTFDLVINYIDDYLGENKSYTMKFINGFTSGDKILIDFKNYNIYKNNTVTFSILSLDSPFEEIKFSKDSTISAQKCNIRLITREKLI